MIINYDWSIKNKQKMKIKYQDREQSLGTCSNDNQISARYLKPKIKYQGTGTLLVHIVMITKCHWGTQKVKNKYQGKGTWLVHIVMITKYQRGAQKPNIKVGSLLVHVMVITDLIMCPSLVYQACLSSPDNVSSADVSHRSVLWSQRVLTTSTEITERGVRQGALLTPYLPK